VAYSIPSPQNSAIILLSSLAFVSSFLLAFVSFITVTDFSVTLSFEMGLFGFFFCMAVQKSLVSTQPQI